MRRFFGKTILVKKMIFYTFIDENADHSEEHSAAHKLLSEGLKRLYGISGFRLETGEHGKPYLPDHPEIHFNSSHCKGLVVCGISDKEIGVDGEHVRSFDPRVMKRIFSAEERELVTLSEFPEMDFFRIWTLKEALGKYLGKGIFFGAERYSFSLDGEFPLCKNVSGKIFTQKILNEKWVVSICAHYPEKDFIFIG